MEVEAYKLMNEREGAFWWHAGMRRIIAAQLKRHAPESHDAMILDAGCGTGGMFGVLSRYGRICGIDQSEDALIYARAKNVAQEIKHASISDIPYQDNTFDLAICLDVLYHAMVGDDVRALSELHRVLAPGGVLVVREPAYNWLRGHQDDVVWTKRRYARKELVAKIAKAGFAVEWDTHVNSFLLPLAIAKRISERVYVPNDIAKDTFRTHPVLNALFRHILSAEAELVARVSMPFGLSVLCIARKK